MAFSTACCSAALLLVPSRGETAEKAAPPAWLKDSAAKLESELAAKYGEACRVRLQRGLKQLGQFWRAEDGDAAAFGALRARELRRRPGRRRTPCSTASSDCWKRSTATWPSCATSSASRPTSTAVRVLPLDEAVCRLRSGGPRHRRPVRQQDRLRRAVELSADHAPAAAGRRGEMDAPPMGRGPAGRAVRHPRARRSLAGRFPERVGRRAVHQPVPHLHAPSAGRPTAGGLSRRKCGSSPIGTSATKSRRSTPTAPAGWPGSA